MSNIAEFDPNINLAPQNAIILEDQSSIHCKVNWLNPKDSTASVKVVKETFRVILDYLRNFYTNEYPTIYDPKALENIKTIMVLVGEAAKKLDKYTALFQDKHVKSVTELKEYKNLQDFYLSKIARKIDEGVLGKWILGLTQRVQSERIIKPKIKLEGKGSLLAKHVFIDLESAKKDGDYELFLLRKEDGTRFFSPRLIRNIKLVTDFGDFFAEERADDPLSDIYIWQDKVAYYSAQNLIQNAHLHIEKFYNHFALFKESELGIELNKSLMALMLAANPHNLSHNLPIKNCRDYLHDFQLFLRHCLHSRDYEPLMVSPSEGSILQANILVTTIQALCQALYAHLDSLQEITSWVHGLIQSAKSDFSTAIKDSEKEGTDKLLAGQLSRDYALMSKLMKLHSNGPMAKILEALESGNYREFDPLMQENLPSQLYNLHIQKSSCAFARWPSPTHQEFIHKATVNDEFKAFLHSCTKDSKIKRCLLINLQDRVNWKDHVRCSALESLAADEIFKDHIDVVTLAKDTEFYHQLAPYHMENHADLFINQFEQQLKDEKCGFYFSKECKKVLQPKFLKGVMKGIHRLFFSEKNVLLREHRLDFIEIFYLFLELKIIELSKPNIAGFACKDSIDIGEAASIQFFIFLKLLNQESLTESDRENLDLMLYGPTLLYRERIMQPERFNRLISAIKAIEEVRQQHGQKHFKKLILDTFGEFFQTPILDGKVIPCHKVIHKK